MSTVVTIRRKTELGKKIQAALSALNGSYTKVGFPEGDVKARRIDGRMTNAALAVIHNYGSNDQRIPPRPFMDEACKTLRKSPELKTLQLGLVSRVYKGTSDIKSSLSTIGEFATGTIKSSIRDGSWKANADSTAARKHSSKPLIDTQQMLNSVTHKEVVV